MIIKIDISTITCNSFSKRAIICLEDGRALLKNGAITYNQYLNSFTIDSHHCKTAREAIGRLKKYYKVKKIQGDYPQSYLYFEGKRKI